MRMPERIGVKEFKDKATQMLRRVRERKEEIIVTMDGEPIAIVRPFTQDDRQKLALETQRKFLRKGAALACQMADQLDANISALEAVASQRRTL